MSNKTDVRTVLRKQYHKDIKAKKIAIHEQFKRIKLLSNFHPTNEFYIALAHYETALINEIEFLGPNNEHPEICSYLLEDLVRSLISRDFSSFYQKFNDFIQESQNTKCYPRLKMTAISLCIILTATAITATAMIILNPSGIMFVISIFAASMLIFLLLVCINTFISNNIYKTIFDSESKANKLAKLIDKHNISLRLYSFHRPSEIDNNDNTRGPEQNFTLNPL